MKYVIPFLCLATQGLADAPVVTAAEISPDGRVSVTLTHPDTGWDHYADGWRVEDADGTVLGLRVLAHPHVNEQPFTRSLSGVTVPDGAKSVFIRARCFVDGWSDAVFELELK